MKNLINIVKKKHDIQTTIMRSIRSRKTRILKKMMLFFFFVDFQCTNRIYMYIEKPRISIMSESWVRARRIILAENIG
jgi:hypothetical protein